MLQWLSGKVIVRIDRRVAHLNLTSDPVLFP